MKKLFTSLRNCSENDKGFSLVELIIVIAIMVALVALLAPQFVKYVQRSRDAVVKSAAEDVLAVSKSEFALGHLTLKGDSSGRIIVQTNRNNQLTVFLEENFLSYHDDDGNELGQTGFRAMCGIDNSRSIRSDDAYVITIARGNQFSTSTQAADFSESFFESGGNSDTPVTGG